MEPLKSQQLPLSLPNSYGVRSKKRYGITFEIDPDLKRFWKADCAMLNISMPEGLCLALELWVKTNEEKREAQRKKDEALLKGKEVLTI